MFDMIIIIFAFVYNFLIFDFVTCDGNHQHNHRHYQNIDGWNETFAHEWNVPSNPVIFHKYEHFLVRVTDLTFNEA